MEYLVNNLKDTQKLAIEFAKSLKVGDLVVLSGDLGAGKTTFTQFVFKALGVEAVVNSPTFAVLKTYNCDRCVLHHFDTYRITTEEAIECGFDETLSDKNAIIFIEWASNIADLIPKKKIEISISIKDDNSRLFKIIRKQG